MAKLQNIVDQYLIYLTIGFVAIVVKLLDVVAVESSAAMDYLVVVINIGSLVFFCIACFDLWRRYIKNIWLLHGITIATANFCTVLLDLNLDYFFFQDEAMKFTTSSFAAEYVSDLKFAVTYWGFATLINLAFQHRQKKQTNTLKEGLSIQPLGFLKDLPPAFNKRPDVIEAQENYINVYSGNDMHTIHYRFKDAVAEMGAEVGLQVHRSYWVRKSSIAEFSKKQGRGEIQTTTGKTIPVSRTYLKSVEALDSH